MRDSSSGHEEYSKKEVAYIVGEMLDRVNNLNCAVSKLEHVLNLRTISWVSTAYIPKVHCKHDHQKLCYGEDQFMLVLSELSSVLSNLSIEVKQKDEQIRRLENLM